MPRFPQDGYMPLWLKWGAKELEKVVEQSEHESEWLLSALLNCSRSDLLQSHNPLTNVQADQFQQWISRRKKGEPAQYITGWTEFYGRKFVVNPGVLIPRQETERLVDISLHTMLTMKKPQVVDIGTGSGCVAVSIAAEVHDSTVTGIDISTAALLLAEENSVLNHIGNVQFLQMDFLKQIPAQPQYDLLVMNPPYIPIAEMETLMDEVLQYEPVLALTDHQDGLIFYRHLAETAAQWVKSGGWLIMEVGRGEHPQKAYECFKSKPFSEHEIIQDFNSDDRVLKVRVN